MKKKIYQNDIDGCMTLYGEHIEPFNAFYSREIVENIREYLMKGEKSIHKLIKPLNFNFVEEKTARRFSPNWDMFINFNTRDDINEYIKTGSCD